VFWLVNVIIFILCDWLLAYYFKWSSWNHSINCQLLSLHLEPREFVTVFHLHQLDFVYLFCSFLNEVKVRLHPNSFGCNFIPLVVWFLKNSVSTLIVKEFIVTPTPPLCCGIGVNISWNCALFGWTSPTQTFSDWWHFCIQSGNNCHHTIIQVSRLCMRSCVLHKLLSIIFDLINLKHCWLGEFGHFFCLHVLKVMLCLLIANY